MDRNAVPQATRRLLRTFQRVMARSQVLALPRPFGPEVPGASPRRSAWVAGSRSGAGAASFADMNDDDATLVARTGAGDQLAFEQLVSRYERRLQRYLRSMVRDEEKAKELADQIAANGPLALQAVLKSLRESADLGETEALANELQIGAPIFLTNDAKEGPSAFAEKREPNFTGT